MIGDSLSAGDSIGIVHARSEQHLIAASEQLVSAYNLGSAHEVPDRPTIIERVAE